jgi:hypothetical protein
MVIVPQLADPPKPIKIEQPPVEMTQPPPPLLLPQPPVVVLVQATSQPIQDSENNNGIAVEQLQQHVETERPVSPVQQQPEVHDINDTNNNNYQKATPDDEEQHDDEMAGEPIEVDDVAVLEVPQDTNNNNNNSTETDEKTGAEGTVVVVMDGPINYDDDQWSPANMSGKKYYTRDQLLKLKDAVLVPPLRLPEGVANTLSKNNKDFLANTLTQVMPPMTLRTPFDAINSVAPKFMMNTPGNRNPYPPKRTSQQGNKQQVRIG